MRKDFLLLEPFAIEDDGKWIIFYVGRNFFNRISKDYYKYVMNEYNPVYIKYISKKIYDPTYGLSISILFFKQKIEKNIVYDIEFTKKPTTKKEEQELQKLRQLFNQDYFLNTYRQQRENYICFSILFFINALIFSWIVHRIKSTYLTEKSYF